MPLNAHQTNNCGSSCGKIRFVTVVQKHWVWPRAMASNAHHTNGRHSLFAPTHNYTVHIKLAVRTLEMYYTPGTYYCYLQPWMYPPASFSMRCYQDKKDNTKTRNTNLLMVCDDKREIPSWPVGCFCCQNPDNGQETSHLTCPPTNMQDKCKHLMGVFTYSKPWHEKLYAKKCCTFIFSILKRIEQRPNTLIAEVDNKLYRSYSTLPTVGDP